MKTVQITAIILLAILCMLANVFFREELNSSNLTIMMCNILIGFLALLAVVFTLEGDK